MNWTKLWEILKNPTVQRCLLFIALIFCIFFWVKSCNSNQNVISIGNNNFDAYKDTIKRLHLANGQLEYEKLMLITDKEGLEKYSDSLRIELEKEKKNVKIITMLKIVYRDTIIYVDSSKYRRLNDSSYIIDWKFEDFTNSVYKRIVGNTRFDIDSNTRNLSNVFSYLNESALCIDVVTGVREISPGRFATFVRTREKNSTISFESMESAIVDPELFNNDNDWIIIGPQVGCGYYGGFGMYVGVGVTVKLWGTHF